MMNKYQIYLYGVLDLIKRLKTFVFYSKIILTTVELILNSIFFLQILIQFPIVMPYSA